MIRKGQEALRGLREDNADILDPELTRQMNTLEEKCGQADAEYMDVTAGLTDANGCLPREITTDNDSHLNAEGFGIFVRNMLDYAQARYEEGLWAPDRALTEKEDLV